MFQIRAEQMRVLSTVLEGGYLDRLLRHLRACHGEALARYPADTHEEIARIGVARARSYGLTWESSLAAFVAMMLEIGLDFDEHPAVRGVLCDEDTTPDLRIGDLPERVSAEEWEAISRSRHARDLAYLLARRPL
jgi:hypothetical protein